MNQRWWFCIKKKWDIHLLLPFVRLCGCRSWGVRGCCGWLPPGLSEYPNLWSSTTLDVLDFKLKGRGFKHRFHERIPELLTWQPRLLQSGFCRRWPWIWRGSKTVASVVDGEKSFVLQTHSSGLIRFNPLNGWFFHCLFNEQNQFHIQHTLARQLWGLAKAHATVLSPFCQCLTELQSQPQTQSQSHLLHHGVQRDGWKVELLEHHCKDLTVPKKRFFNVLNVY